MKWLKKLFKSELDDAEELEIAAQYQRRRHSSVTVLSATRRASYVNPVTGQEISWHKRDMDAKVYSHLVLCQTLKLWL